MTSWACRSIWSPRSPRTMIARYAWKVLGGKAVAEDVREQELADPAPRLGRPEGLLEPREVVRALEHLRGGPAELADLLHDLGRRLAGALLRGEQAPVQPLEGAADLGAPRGELVARLLPLGRELGAQEAHEQHPTCREEREDEHDEDHC